MEYGKTILILAGLCIISPVIAQNSSQDYEIVYTGPSGEGLEINQVDPPEMKYEGNKVLYSFDADRSQVSEEQDVYVRVYGNNSWYTDGISSSSVTAFKGENLKSSSTFRKNNSFDILVEESGTYHLIGLNSTSTWDFYLADGECSIVLSPSEDYSKIESCDSLYSKIYTSVPGGLTIGLTLLSVIGLSVISLLAYIALPRLLEKLILRKNNKVMRKAVELNDLDSRNSVLKRLINADKKALEGSYLESYRIIREIESMLEEKN